MTRNRLQTAALLALSGGLGAAVFALDLTLPLGVGIGAPYVAMVLIGLWLPWRSAPIILAGVATVLTVADYFLSAPGGVPWLVFANRGLALFATWLAAFLLVWRRTSEQALRESQSRARRAEARLRDAIQAMSDGFVLWDADDRLVLCNTRYVRLYREAGRSFRPGLTFEQVARLCAASGVIADAHDRTEAWLAERLDRHRHRLGEPFEVELSDGGWLRVCEYRTAEGGAVSVLTDITDLKRRERALGESEQRYRRLVEMAPDAIVIQQEGRFTFANPQAIELLGARSAGQILNRPVADFVHPDDWPAVEARIRRLSQGDGTIEPLEERLIRLDGRVIDVEDRTAAITEGGRLATQGILRDITGRKWAEEYIRRLAYHDALTGLPNRLLLQDRLQQALARARREGGYVAVMLLDLDHFKDVNDTLGHPAGDQLLCAVAERLRALIRETDTLARLGGDEFIIVQTGLRDLDGARVLAQKVSDALAEPFAIDHTEVHTTTSVGITVFPNDATEPDLLIRNADLALYRAKAEGRGRFRFFLPAMTTEVRARKGLENDLRRALELGNQLRLVYQPQLDLQGGRVAGVEALLRWRHPEQGNVPPAVFIPVAEASGLIRPLGAWVLREACRQARTWRDAGQELAMAVNLSPVQLMRQNLVAQVAEILGHAELEPELLELEITENVLIDPTRRPIAAALQQMADLGVNLTIDDFGTGYASLSYLKSLPVKKVKINGAFIRDIGRNRGDEAIVRAIVALSHSLNKGVVAECVEREAQLAFVSGQGCDQAQGFLLGRPQTPEDLGRFLAAWPETWQALKAAVGLVPAAARADRLALSGRRTLH